jgi:hypothetical protein
MLKKVNQFIDQITNFLNELIGTILKFLFETGPAILVLFIIVAVLIQVFKVVVLGVTP